ncbi:MAG: hypothetical protein ACI4JW_07530 [Oscillospiraceae bacterium]
MDSELVRLLLRVLGTTMLLMAMIMLCCVVTPHLAKLIDKRLGNKKDNAPENPADPDEPSVKGPYDASSDEEYDLNYKIYNKDIYGVDFKHGKEE